MPVSCENVARQILPLYRAYVAKELVEKYGYTQVSAAKKLGTTQPAVSQYLSSKRGRQKIARYDEILPLVQRAAEKVAQRMAKADMSIEEFNDSFCDLCRELQEHKQLR
ncbi:MAG: Fis family transcriptional regulator [Candidatus Bathyarchaeia archaeon]